LKDVSFTVEPGERVAFVGHTGAGKTTITNLLLRFYDIQRGQILLDGVDLREMDLEELRSNFSIFFRRVSFFRDNRDEYSFGQPRNQRRRVTRRRSTGSRRHFHPETA